MMALRIVPPAVALDFVNALIGLAQSLATLFFCLLIGALVAASQALKKPAQAKHQHADAGQNGPNKIVSVHGCMLHF